MSSRSVGLISITAIIVLIVFVISVNSMKVSTGSTDASANDAGSNTAEDDLVLHAREETCLDPLSKIESQPETTEDSIVITEQTEPIETETLPPETDPPETLPPETEPPVTEPPVTTPPVTEPPVTEPPVTEPPETQKPDTTTAETTPSTEPSDPPAPEEVTFTTSKGFTGVVKNGVTYIDGYLIANKTYSLPKSYGDGLTKKTKSAFEEMAAAAKKEKLDIYIVSGFRSYSYQANLYNNYVKRDGAEKADTYSARPGHSEHQSGLAFDLNSVKNSFANTKEAVWLSDNCYKFGFILRYPKGKTGETGYQYEPWHFRYVGVELATILYNGGDWITMEDYFGITSEYK